MTEIDWTEIHARLSSPDGMHVKQFKGRGGKFYDYIDARQVMDRLDEVVGPGNWASTFRGPFEGLAVECTLTIHGVPKTDVGYPNDAKDGHDNEGLKAAYSDALKRAAVHWGIGRFLYEDAPHEAPQQRPHPQRVQSAPERTADPSAQARKDLFGDEVLACEDCGEVLQETRFKDGTVWSASDLAGYGRRKHGRTLCMADYKAANEQRKSQLLTA